jgi:hypothetical protein
MSGGARLWLHRPVAGAVPAARARRGQAPATYVGWPDLCSKPVAPPGQRQQGAAAARLGHDIAKLPVRDPHGGSAKAGTPIQRALDTSRLREAGTGGQIGKLAKHLARGAAEFNELEASGAERQEQLHGQFAALHAVETRANAHLRDQRAGVAPEDRAALFDLLHQVDEHRTRLTARTLESGADLWLPQEVEGEDRQHAQDLWRSIAGGHGNLQVESATPGFREEALSSVGKLLQTPHGRGLLAELDAPQQKELRQVVVSEDFTKRFASLPEATHEEGSWAQPISKAHGLGNLHEDPKAGTGSYVRIAGDRPGTLEEHEMGVEEEPIFAPRFITLGHELGHARHQLRGVSKNPVTGEPPSLDRLLWTEPEEKENITVEENRLREEHGLAQRQYHVSISAARAHRARFPLNQKLSELTESVPEELRGHLSDELEAGDLSWDIDHFDAADEQAAARLHDRLQALEKRIPGWLAQKSQGPVETAPRQQSPGWAERAGRFARQNWGRLAVGGAALGVGGYLLSKYLRK